MSNKIDSTTPSKAQWFKTEIDRLNKVKKELLTDIKEAQKDYFGYMHVNARYALRVYQGKSTKKEYKDDYAVLCDKYKHLWSLVVQYEATCQELDKIYNERYHYYVKLREQGYKDNPSD